MVFLWIVIDSKSSQVSRTFRSILDNPNNAVVWMVFTHLLMFKHWSLSDSNSPQVLWTFLSILADPNNAVVWMLFTRPLISESSCLFTTPLVTVPSKPVTNEYHCYFIFPRFFFSSLASSANLFLFLLSFNLILLSAGMAKSTIWLILFFLLMTINGSCRLAEIR